MMLVDVPEGPMHTLTCSTTPQHISLVLQISDVDKVSENFY
jgi:hypothetical protein